MGQWLAYVDEGYNTKTFCVGGFLAPEGKWTGISSDWSERIEYERRWAIKKGLKPISRYHATDCANLKKQFDKKTGWDIKKQINLTKRLCAILSNHLPIGLVVGASLEDVQCFLPPDPEEAKILLYSMCIKMCFLHISGLMQEHVHEPSVKIFHERGEYDSFAKEAFDQLKGDNPALFGCLESIEAKGWEDCTPLQCADFMAYQGFQKVGASLKGDDAIRKSLQALLSKDMLISIVHYQKENFADILKMIENKKAGKPLDEGVHSALQHCVGDFLPYIP